MQTIKIKHQNLTQKIMAPASYKELLMHIESFFGLSSEHYTLLAGNQIINNNASYQKALLDGRTKFIIKTQKGLKYYLLCEDQKVEVLSEGPSFKRFEKEYNVKHMKTSSEQKQKKQKKQEVFGKLVQNEDQIQVILENPQENVWLTCVEGGMVGYRKKIEQNDTIKVDSPWRSTWRLQHENEKIKKPFGNKLIFQSKGKDSEKADYILALGQKIRELLGGEVIRYVRYIRAKQLQDLSANEIVYKIIEDDSFFE